MMQVSSAALQEDVAQARSAMCSTVEALHQNTVSLLGFFSAQGLHVPQHVQSLVDKMAAQVGYETEAGFGTPVAARGLAAVLTGQGASPVAESIAKVQDWHSNPSILDSLSPGALSLACVP